MISTKASAVKAPTPGCVLSRCVSGHFSTSCSIDEPGTLEAGDVLRLGLKLYVGLSTRTNQQGIEMLRKALKAYGYEVLAIPLKGALHLNGVCTAFDDHTVLAYHEVL